MPTTTRPQHNQLVRSSNDDAAATTVTASKYDNDPWSPENLNDVIALWQLTPRQERRLRDLQRRVQDVDHEWNDPHVLLRYMSTQGYHQTERLFREMIQWRLDHKVDSILEDYTPNPLLMDYTPLAFLKDYDKDGDPIYVERGGAIDAQGLLKRFSKQELDRHAIWLREVQSRGAWVDEYERRQGRCVRDITVIYDLKGLSSRHLNPQVLAWFQGHMQMTDAYYPGPIKRVIIIRAPAIFRAIWSIVKHFFPQAARDKMLFAGPHNYLETLEKYMDLDVLPPCIYPQGKGETAEGMPKRMEGGRIPDHVAYGGSGYVSTIWDNSKYLRTGSNKTSSTTCSEPLTDEEEQFDNNDHHEGSPFKHRITPWIPKGDWEEVNGGVGQQTHVLWEATTGVEITNKELLAEKNLIFI